MLQDKTQLIKEVEKLPMFVLKKVASNLEQFNVWEEDKTKRVITEDGSIEILSLVSDKYKLVQFKEVYEPILTEFTNLEGFLKYYKGSGILVVYPEGDIFNFTEEAFKGKIVILLTNSVDKSLAVNIKFVVYHGGRSFVIPQKENLRALHIGKIKTLIKNYEGFILKVKESWKVILEKFRKRYLDEEEVDNLFKDIRLSKKVRREIKEEITDYNLWDLFVAIVNKISEKD